MTHSSSDIFILMRFRNSDNVGVVIIQCFMILSAILVVAGLLYVGIVMLVIIIHHLVWDRNPHVVPPYVKRALQFESDEDDDFDPSTVTGVADSSSRGVDVGEKAARRNDEGVFELVDDNESFDDEPKARRIANLDKFMQGYRSEQGSRVGGE